jgi:hypothetical protein
MAKGIEAEIDTLFQLPPDQFTAARNTLAKGTGSQAGAIKALTRPPIAAWAVNQLYWKDPERYEALADASNDMRRTHRAVIEGRKGDLRVAGREHEAALEAALKSTLALLKGAGQPATDATRHAILNTLRALPSEEPAGRLTMALTPGGFEMLAGLTPTPSAPAARTVPRATPAQKTGAANGKKGRPADARADREGVKARARQAAAERAVRDADQRARQAEFEAARAARDATRTERRLEETRRELEAAQEAFDEAGREAEKATRTRDTADRRLRDAQAALVSAKART